MNNSLSLAEKQKKTPLIIYKVESKEINSGNYLTLSIENNKNPLEQRKNQFNIMNSLNSNLPSTISDSKEKDKIFNNKKIKPKTATTRKYQNNNFQIVKKEKIKSKGKNIINIDIENDNNIMYLKQNLRKINTEGELNQNGINIINESKENNHYKSINDLKIEQNKIISKNKNQIKTNTNINIINDDINKENRFRKIDKKSLDLFQNKRGKTSNFSCNKKNERNNISSFDKRKKYIVPMVKSKKKKKIKIVDKKIEKKENDKEKIKEIKEIMATKLIQDKQVEYLKEYQKYMDDFNNKILKNNEKKFRIIQEEGFELDELFIEEEDNQNDTIDEIYEKEEGEGEGEEEKEKEKEKEKEVDIV